MGAAITWCVSLKGLLLPVVSSKGARQPAGLDRMTDWMSWRTVAMR